MRTGRCRCRCRLLQASLLVQGLLSSQLPPESGENTQPKLGEQPSAEQRLPSLHTLALPLHRPSLQLSFSLHALLSLQFAALLA